MNENIGQEEWRRRAPLTPKHADLRDYPFYPIDIARLKSSATHAKLTPAEFQAAFMLWTAAFHQVPAGSLPDDEILLCKLADFGKDLKGFQKISAGALRGWKKCCDGLMYHNVVAEVVLEGWIGKLYERKSSAAGNAKKYNRPFNPAEYDAEIISLMAELRALNPNSRYLSKIMRRMRRGKAPESPDGLPSGARRDSRRTPGGLPSGSQGDSGQVTGDSGQVTGEIPYKDSETTSLPPADAGTLASQDPRTRLFQEGLSILSGLTGKSPDSTRRYLGRTLKGVGDDAGMLLGFIRRAQTERAGDPVGFIGGCVRAMAPKTASDGREASAAARLRENDQLRAELNGHGGELFTGTTIDGEVYHAHR